mgnify:CR=1 FL=1
MRPRSAVRIFRMLVVAWLSLLIAAGTSLANTQVNQDPPGLDQTTACITLHPNPGLPDLLIVGGGPAGLATAIAARLAGLTATVLDRSRPPIDKPCGEGLMPAGVARLEALGVRLAEGAGRPFRGIRYRDGELVADRGRRPCLDHLVLRVAELDRGVLGCLRTEPDEGPVVARIVGRDPLVVAVERLTGRRGDHRRHGVGGQRAGHRRHRRPGYC